VIGSQLSQKGLREFRDISDSRGSKSVYPLVSHPWRHRFLKLKGSSLDTEAHFEHQLMHIWIKKSRA